MAERTTPTLRNEPWNNTYTPRFFCHRCPLKSDKRHSYTEILALLQQLNMPQHIICTLSEGTTQWRSDAIATRSALAHQPFVATRHAITLCEMVSWYFFVRHNDFIAMEKTLHNKIRRATNFTTEAEAYNIHDKFTLKSSLCSM